MSTACVVHLRERFDVSGRNVHIILVLSRVRRKCCETRLLKPLHMLQPVSEDTGLPSDPFTHMVMRPDGSSASCFNGCLSSHRHDWRTWRPSLLNFGLEMGTLRASRDRPAKLICPVLPTSRKKGRCVSPTARGCTEWHWTLVQTWILSSV